MTQTKNEASKGKPNSVTPELIESRIKETEFRTIEVFGKKFMFCFIKMDNDFVQVGKPSVCVDDTNFNVEDGKSISYENSLEELWKLEGYRMMSEKVDTPAFLEKHKPVHHGNCDPSEEEWAIANWHQSLINKAIE